MPRVIQGPFSKSAQDVPDIAALVARPVVGLSYAVQKSFQEQVVPDVGLVGWSFVQHGLRYACCYKSPENNDSYQFVVQASRGQPYLHRGTKVCVAEKIHMLTVIDKMLSPDVKGHIGRHLYGLERACFDSASGIFKNGNQVVHRLSPDGPIIAYIGLAFPGDTHYKDLPQLTLFALEWGKGNQRYMIDCSHVIPDFTISSAVENSGGYINMTRTEALRAVAHVKEKLLCHDPHAHQLATDLKLWARLEDTAEWLSEVRGLTP